MLPDVEIMDLSGATCRALTLAHLSRVSSHAGAHAAEKEELLKRIAGLKKSLEEAKSLHRPP